ncbi:Foramidopyrimidine-DNA glycosylase [Metamycoplasma auris 15026]|uniref:Foramidopyrimidine-DNA glycosylase n=1 Tax=Metamycoplasma auris 15026 TaxID=1188233 RepID=N9TR60_9BACT|nr:DNA-formamidopyrimidine glycosylase [Metamycoplasma auris]ENY68565.1 Foramidopyrimidine-DNA glycosylase [Metamycoplasma auris 15026]
MPELPEVKVVIKNLKEAILFKKIKKIEIFKEKLFKEYSPKEFQDRLHDATIIDITNIGKFIIFHFDNDAILLSHLRMEGKYRFFEKETEPNKHVMVKFVFYDGSELHYLDTRMFGTMHLRNKDNYLFLSPLVKMAAEPKDTDIDWLYEQLSTSGSSIKSKLLDQSYVVGLGNIYVDEALFASKVHPLSKAKNIPKEKLEEILKNAQEIMDQSYLMGGSTIHTYESFNGQIGSYQEHLKIHNDKLEWCKVCGDEVEKIKVSGRGTYLCSSCQRRY